MLIVILAVIICPMLFAMGILMNFLNAEKSFDTARHMATKSISIFQFKTIQMESLPQKGRVRLDLSNDSNDSDILSYHVTVETCQGFSFAISKGYAKACSFAQQLAQFLGYELVDVTEPSSRKN